jgi:hypothetical protein
MMEKPLITSEPKPDVALVVSRIDSQQKPLVFAFEARKHANSRLKPFRISPPYAVDSNSGATDAVQVELRKVSRLGFRFRSGHLFAIRGQDKRENTFSDKSECS